MRGCQAVLQVALHALPFRIDDGEDDGVARRAVGMPLVVAQHAVLLGAEAGDGGARGGVEPAGFQHHADTAQRFKACCSSNSLASVLAPVRCTRGAYQV
jgi:hypothetical protein